MGEPEAFASGCFMDDGALSGTLTAQGAFLGSPRTRIELASGKALQVFLAARRAADSFDKEPLTLRRHRAVE